MDPKTGLLTQDELTQAIAFINDKALAPNDECLVCGDPNSSVAAGLVRIDVGYADKNATTHYQPMLPVICNNCGFTRLFHPHVMGIIPPPPIPDEGEEEGE